MDDQMIDPRPFARPRDLEALEGFRRLVDTFRTVHGRQPTQEELDAATADAGLGYRISLDWLRAGMA